MTKHPAQASKTPPRTAPHPEQAPELHPWDSEPANRRTGKWRIENWNYARWTPPARPTQFRLRWEEEPWRVGHGIGLPTERFTTWQAAMAYVNERIRAANDLQDRLNATLERLDNAQTLGVLAPVEAQT